ncbi:MAG: hypothetical protein CL840_21460 [Crocinitomicaceae bacterium]|nr:hypothetical protein [Crocinitomicaceae bacterium]|tara:strand:+ start:14870 stop:15355 length:486 start_codon:yes stop_codon:yes gene_type:complete
MDVIQRILNIEEGSYSSSLNEESLKRKIENLFEQTTLRLAGKLTSENEFTAYDKLVIIGWNMPYLRRKSAYLKGKITQGQNGPLIKLKVNPNSILPIFSILAILSGVIFTLIALSNTQVDKFFLIPGLVLIALGIVYYPVSTLLRNRLRNEMVNYLDLNKI